MVTGRSGWVRYQAADLPGVAYLRFCRNARQRWTVREVFVDGMKAELTATTMGRIPFVVLEAMVNSPEYEALCATAASSHQPRAATLQGRASRFSRPEWTTNTSTPG